MNGTTEVVYCHACDSLIVVEGDRLRASQDHALDEHRDSIRDCLFTALRPKQ